MSGGGTRENRPEIYGGLIKVNLPIRAVQESTRNTDNEIDRSVEMRERRSIFLMIDNIRRCSIVRIDDIIFSLLLLLLPFDGEK